MKVSHREMETFQINTRIKLGTLWVTLMLLYIYCDIYSFHRPGYINEIIDGMLGIFKVNQEVLAIFGLLMIIPALMIPACIFLNPKASKWINIIIGTLYLLVNISNLVGESWIYYWIFGFIETIFTIVIIVLSIQWKEDKI